MPRTWRESRRTERQQHLRRLVVAQRDKHAFTQFQRECIQRQHNSRSRIGVRIKRMRCEFHCFYVYPDGLANLSEEARRLLAHHEKRFDHRNQLADVHPELVNQPFSDQQDQDFGKAVARTVATSPDNSG